MDSFSAAQWNVGQRSGLVSINTHRLFLSVSGPDRQPGEPVVLLLTGVSSTLAEWPVAIRMIASTTRIVAYDRAGFGQSDKSPNNPTPATINAELGALLNAAAIDPPFILLGHSWGGILIMDFLASRSTDVAGMIFIDAVAPDASNEDQTPWKNPVVVAVNGDLDYREVTGLKKNTALSTVEYQAYMDEEASEKHQCQAVKEHFELDRSYASLAKKALFEKQPPILGNRPVYVLYAHSDRDFQKLYAAGVEAGNGTTEERTTYRKMLDVWEKRELAVQKQFLILSTNTRFLETEWCGHNVQLMEPSMIADAVKWTVDHLV